jgi:hypothetical protein
VGFLCNVWKDSPIQMYKAKSRLGRAVAIALFLLANIAHGAKTVPLSDTQLVSLLAERLDGSMGDTFAQFANMFLVRSHLDLTHGIVLSTPDDSVAEAELMSVFPRAYQPTLREFLDAIALQTHTRWQYVTESPTLQSSSSEPVKGVACFQFNPAKSGLDFTIAVPEGWTIRDGGNRLMCCPRSFPVGIDFYEVGQYSFKEGASNKMEGIVDAVALEWAGRAKPGAAKADMKKAKVGDYEALSFVTRVPSRLGVELIWRQWVFAAGNRCYFVISTLDDENATKLKSDVEGILQSFKIGKKSSQL